MNLKASTGNEFLLNGELQQLETAYPRHHSRDFFFSSSQEGAGRAAGARLIGCVNNLERICADGWRYPGPTIIL